MIAFLVFISGPGNAWAQTPITCGESINGEINPGSEQDFYTFAAQAGDRIWVSLVKTGGSGFSPRAALLDPAGAEVATVGSAGLEVLLSAAGSYTLRVRDNIASYAGTYTLTVEWVWPLSKQCGIEASLTCGVASPPSAAIDPGSEQDLYRFAGEAGDRIWVSLVKTGGSGFSPRADLLDPAGTLLGTVGSSGREFALLTPGSYTLRVRDNIATYAGTYQLKVEFADKPCPPVGATLTIDGTSTSTKQQGDTFVFSGNGFSPGGGVDRWVRRPDGSELKLEPTLTASVAGTIEWTFTPTCGDILGTHTVWADDRATGKLSNEVFETITSNPNCGDVVLRFPIAGLSSSTAPLSAAFDHAMAKPYSKNAVVIAFDGTRAQRKFGPGTMQAGATDREIRLTWTGALGATEYQIVGKPGGTAPTSGALCVPNIAAGEILLYQGTDTSFTHYALTNGLKYSYRLCIVEPDGSKHAGLKVTAIPSLVPATKKATDECLAFKQSGGSPVELSTASYTGVTACGKGHYMAYDGHPAVDYAIAYGTPVQAAIGGRVSYLTPTPTMAKPLKYHALLIDPQDGSGYTVMYLHLSSYLDTVSGLVKRDLAYKTPVVCTECPLEGEFVSAGDVIGYVGNWSGGWGKVGAHLHFEVALGGVPVDPYGWRAGGTDPYLKAINLTLWADLAPPVSEIVSPVEGPPALSLTGFAGSSCDGGVSSIVSKRP